MPDRVSLKVGGIQVENFLSYSIEADLYTADDAFSLELANPGAEISAGTRCELQVNGALELTGIVDKVIRGGDKQKNTLKAEGRDLMGLLVDSYCEEFIDLAGMTVKALAERLIKKVPFINRKDVSYQKNVVGKLKGRKKGHSSSVGIFDTAQAVSKIEPGMTVFETLKTYAASRGLLFYALPNGTFVFGTPKAKGEPVFRLVRRKEDGRENNVVSGEKVEDLSKRYSKVTVIGQQQGFDGIAPTAINTKATVTDTEFPFYKPYVARDNNDAASPKLHAKMLLEKMRREGFSLSYKVAGHAQGEMNWTINELCQVTDEVAGVDGVFLIYGRTFELSRQSAFTILKLGPPGVLQ